MDNESLQEQLKIHKNKTRIVIMLVFCLVTSFLGFLIGLKIGTPASENAALTKVLNILENEWYAEIYYDSYEDAPVAQFVSSIVGLDTTKQLDPYTYLIKRSTGTSTPTKEYGKMGVRSQNLFNRNFQLIKVIYPNSPAEDAGLLPYDLIYGVKLADNSVVTDNYEIYLQQEVNHSITLLVARYDTVENKITYLELPITFKRFNFPTAYQIPTTLEDTLYLKIDEFVSDINGTNTIDLVKQILKKNQNGKYLILDLKDNSGGAVDSLVEICDLFLPEKKLISTIEVKDKSTSKYKTKDDEVYSFDHIFIFINGNTASASEMLIGCLGYYFKDSLTLIGSTTFGKGIAQRTINISPKYDFQYTFAKWFTPDNKWIHNVGFNPTSDADVMTYASNYQRYLQTSLDFNLKLTKDKVDTKNILLLQYLFNEVYGADIRTDGYFDINMEEFVKQLQASYQIEETGIIDEDLLLYLAFGFSKEVYNYEMQYQNRVETIINSGANN